MKYVKLFANCLIVFGAKNALICDLQKNESELIPIEIGKVLQSLNSKISIEDILLNYNSDDIVVITDYINYVIEKGYGFYCESEDFNLFPNLNTKYETPYKITNAIIERNSKNINEIGHILEELENLNCQYISIVFYHELSKENFNDIFNQFYNRKLKSFDIVSKWSEHITKNFFKSIPDNIQLSHLSFFGMPAELNDYKIGGFNFSIFFSTENVKNFSHCGKVNIQSFNTNLPKVLEAVNFNSCLYKKISIDINGNIKNCPALPESFGNLESSTLEQALENTNLKKYWNLNKDEINICKDCEFRYICTDCRAYTELTHLNEKGLDISKPLKCGYNPYSGKWEEWSSNPLKQKAIKFYKMD